MNIVAPPNLKLIEFSMGPYNPTRQLVRFPFSGKTEQYIHSPPSWAGTVGWGTADPNFNRHIEKRKLLIRFHSLLQGLGIVRLNLPKDYQPTNEAPENISGEVTAVNDNFEVTIDYVQQGMFVNVIGDYITLGNRLYLITAINGNVITVLPKVKPEIRAVAEIKKPFVNATLDGSSPISRRGGGLISHSFPWYEDVL